MKVRFLFSYLCFGTVLWFTACSKPVSGDNPIPDAPPIYDTAFTINSISFPHAEAQQNSVISEGNLFRLETFIKKAKMGASLKIGYIGGSITEGAAASIEENQYVHQFQQALMFLFPKSTFSIINAGIGASYSRFACSRAQYDLLSSKPDLVIIEFAVNDRPYDSIGVTQSMEGLVRQCLKTDSSMPILMFMAMHITGDTVVAHYHSIVGRYYSLPIVSYNNAIWPFVENGQIPWSSISPDAVHPNDNGHKIMAYLLYSFVKDIYKRMNTITPESLPMPTPIFSDIFEYAGIHSDIQNDPVQLDSISGWNAIVKENNRLGYTSTDSAAYLEFSTSVRELTIGYHYWKNLSGRIEIELDGQVIDTLTNNFANDWGNGYMRVFEVYKQNTNSPHSIKIRNLDNSLFEIRYLLYAD